VCLLCLFLPVWTGSSFLIQFLSTTWWHCLSGLLCLVAGGITVRWMTRRMRAFTFCSLYSLFWGLSVLPTVLPDLQTTCVVARY
jgi:dolichyl-phosphate-mannose--protein O-mannosyl transferase